MLKLWLQKGNATILGGVTKATMSVKKVGSIKSEHIVKSVEEDSFIFSPDKQTHTPLHIHKVVYLLQPFAIQMCVTFSNLISVCPMFWSWLLLQNNGLTLQNSFVYSAYLMERLHNVSFVPNTANLHLHPPKKYV